MSALNRLHNSANPYQGDYKKVLCICSAGLLRSPTAAFVLSQEPYNYNTRAAGIEADFALIVVDDVLVTWADEIVVMSKAQERAVMAKLKKMKIMRPIACLGISDNHAYRSPELLVEIKTAYAAYLEERKHD